jgi:ATP-dependent DNA ligase
LTSDVEVVNFDGERCVARKEGDAVRLESRTGRTLTGTYPELSVALAGQRLDRFLVDGEVVVFDDGQTSFSRLQQRSASRAHLRRWWTRIRPSTASSTSWR